MKQIVKALMSLLVVVLIINYRERRLRRELADIVRLIILREGLISDAD